MKPSPKTIVALRFEEVIVAANPGAVNTPGHVKPWPVFKALDAISSANNLPCSHRSEVDLGILEAMDVRQAAAKSGTWPSEILVG